MDAYRVKPGKKVRLGQIDPDNTGEFAGTKNGKDRAKDIVQDLTKQLDSLQEMLYAEHKNKVLIVLQGMDTAGKDGVIRKVFEGVNPAGVNVASFKVPSPDELDHDYLWRIHKRVPAKGEITIFNRSHYEDVLVVRVHELVPESVWRKRYQQICDFERMLVESGTTILKFYLHIDKDEQKERLQARLDDPTKHWKFSVGDLDERKKWDSYMSAFEEALEKTSTDYAPWYIVPANKKWFRDYVIATTLVNALKGLKMTYPEQKDDLSKLKIV